MKVKVRSVQPTITMTKRMYNSYMHDMEQFLEENKTLRLRECHLQDELHIVKQQNKELQQKATDLEDTIEQSRLDTQDSSMRLGHIVAQALQEKKAAQDTAAELNVELMERDCRIDELERQIEWLRDKNDEWAMIANNQKNTIAAHYEEKKAFASFVDVSSVILGKSELDSFMVGFRLGARFVYDTFVDNKTLYNNLLAEESE